MEREKQPILKNKQSGQVDYYLLLKVLQGNFIKILIVAVLIAGFSGLIRYASATPYYTAEVKFLINTVGWAQDYMTGEYYIKNNTTDVVGASNIAYSCPVIIREDRAIGNILDDLVKRDERFQAFSRLNIKGMLNITVDGQIVTVRVTSGNKDIVKHVAQSVETAVPVTMDYYYGIANDEGVENLSSVAKVITSVSDENIIHTGRNVTLYSFLGFVIGAAVVYLLALLRAYFDNTVYTEEDIKSRFNIPVIGQIPTWENYKAGDKSFKDKSRKDRYKKADDKNPDSGNLMSDRDYEGRLLTKKTPFAITEAFKHLRTNMCYTTKGEECAVYGVTSAYVSAGKSMIIANIAISFAQMDKRVLLMDGDLRCPVQHKIFKLDNKVAGLSELLAGVTSIENVYHRSGGYDNLDIITSGRIPPNPAELLASDNMKKFLEYARTQYDVILIDLPPICEVSDAGIISDLVTGYAFVVRAGYSDRRMIEIACETMDGFGASFVGFVLNDIDIKSGDYYKNKYYSGYSKYRFRNGKQGYYRHFKYGYYKSGYSRYNRYSRYGYGGYGGYSGYGGYGTSYSRANNQEAENAELDAQDTDVMADETINETPIVETPVVETPVVETPVVEIPAEEAPAEEAPAEEAPVEVVPTEEAPAEEAPAEEAPTEEAPTEEAPAEEAPAEEAPVEAAPAEEAPAEEASAEEAPVEAAPAEEAPAEEAPAEEASAEEAPVEAAPAEEAPVEAAPAEEAPVEAAPAEEAPVEAAPAEEAPVEEASAEEAPVEAAPAEEASAEEAPVEAAPAEEAPVEAAPAEEALVEAAPAEEASVEESKEESAPFRPEANNQEESQTDGNGADQTVENDESAQEPADSERNREEHDAQHGEAEQAPGDQDQAPEDQGSPEAAADGAADVNS